MSRDATPTREIRAVLATVMYTPEEVEQLRRAFAPAEFIHLHPADADGIASALQHVDVAVLPFDLDDRFLDAPLLRWVHCDHAGLERSARPEVFARGLTVTGSAGRSAPALAQHAFYFALALTFDARRLFERQSMHEWGGIPGYDAHRALHGKTLGVVGFGHTGQAVAELAAAFGMQVVAYRRSGGTQHPLVGLMLSADEGDRLDPLLEQSDVVVIAAGLNDATYRMFSTAQFQRMKSTAFLVNMARGGLVDHDALVAALENGEIAGAGLDVTDPEPLPNTSPLWDMPNVVITPHLTPRLEDRTQRSIDVIIENIGRYRRGETLLNTVALRDRFTPRSNERR